MENAPTATPQTPPPPPAAEPQKQTALPLPPQSAFSKVFFFFLGVAIIFFSAAGGIFFYQQHAPKQTTPLGGLLPNTTPGATKESHFPEGYVTKPPAPSYGAAVTPLGGQGTTPQASWRLYQNPTFNFSLSFPADLTPKESEYGMGVSNIELRNSNNLDQAYSPDIQFLIFPKTLGSLIGQDFNAYYAMPTNGTKIIQDTQGASQSLTKIRNRTISGLRAVDFKTISTSPAPNEAPDIATYVEIGNSIFIISTTESNKQTLEAILQSFTYPLSQ